LEKPSFFEHRPTISDDFDRHLWNFFALWTLNQKKIWLKNQVESLGKKFQKKLA